MTALLYIANVLVWGFTWIAITYQIDEAPPEVAIVYRFLLAAVVLFAILGLGGRLQRIPWRQQPYLVAAGLFMFCTNYVLVYSGAGYIVSGLVALLFSTTTIFNAVNNALFYRERISGRVIAGALLGIAGLACLFARDLTGLELGTGTLAGAALVLAGTYSFSLGNMVSRRNNSAGLHLPTAVAWSMAWGTLLLTCYAVLRGRHFPVDVSPAFLVALLYLAVPGSVVGFLTYLELVRRLGAPVAAFSTVIYPVIALAVSTVFEGYRWTPAGAAGLVLVLAGNVLVFAPAALLRRLRRETSRAPEALERRRVS